MITKRIPSADELRLLVTFLNDPSAHTVALARAQLKEALVAQPALRTVLEPWTSAELKPLVRTMLEDLRCDELFAAWTLVARRGADLDLEEACVLLARLLYPGVTRAFIAGALDQFAEAIDERCKLSESSPRQIQLALARYLFTDLGFQGNSERYNDPDNTYINQVIERRRGLPITLSCLYLFVGWRLNLPVYGVGLPGHFIAAHVVEGRPIYVDAFHGGRILTPMDCAQLVRRRGIEFQERFLFPMPKDQIISRIILNLITLYTEQGQADRAQWLGRVLALLQDPAA
jgi:regulator of sirC expression with transglutaminase-like and TPR domain